MDIELDLIQARIGIVCSMIIMMLFLVIAAITESTLFLILSAVAFVAYLFFSWFNRCPSCGRGLSRHHWFIEYCPYCGEHL